MNEIEKEKKNAFEYGLKVITDKKYAFENQVNKWFSVISSFGSGQKSWSSELIGLFYLWIVWHLS